MNLKRPILPIEPGISLSDKIASAKWGQKCEYEDYDVGFSEQKGRYYVNFEYGCYGIKKNHIELNTVEELEAFLIKRGVDVAQFSVQWDRDVFNGL